MEAFRLSPGDLLRESIVAKVKELGWTATAILTCVGSLDVLNIRMASATVSKQISGPQEIVSLTGTVDRTGYPHIHICTSDIDGQCIGGHLLDGSRVFTTAEIVIVSVSGVRFSRDPDPLTGYSELVVSPLQRQ